jgi:hypothetical protein
MVASGPKLIFDQMAAPVPEIMDDLLYTKIVFLANSLYKIQNVTCEEDVQVQHEMFYTPLPCM